MKKTLLIFAIALTHANAQAQWSNDPSQATCVGVAGTDYYSVNFLTTDTGLSYVTTISPDGQDENGRSRLTNNLQIVKKDGSLLFDEGGTVISNEGARSYLVINQEAYLDNDNNLIYMSHDARNADPTTSHLGYSITKYNSEGEMLWENPVALWDGEVWPGSAGIECVQTTDKGYVFAWFYISMDGSEPNYIMIEKISAEGKPVWKRTIKDTLKPYTNPKLVDAGDNQVILFFMQGSSQYVMAKMLDFDGSDVWASDTKVYQGGFDQTPPTSHIMAWKAPEGGAFFTWRDDRSGEGSFSNYISYIKNDGSYGFPGGVNGLKISHVEYSRMAPQIALDEQEKCIYAAYRIYDQGVQQWQGIHIQKISLEGELLWGPDGREVVPLQNAVSVAYATVQTATDTDIAVFWQDNAVSGGDAHCYYQPYDKDGNPKTASPVSFATTVSEKHSLRSSKLIDNSYFVVNWMDGCDTGSQIRTSPYMQRLNLDGTVGDPATATVRPVTLQTGMEQPSRYNLNGQQVNNVSTPGIYLMKQGKETRKVVGR